MRFVFGERPLASPKGPLQAARTGKSAVKGDVCEGDGLRETIRYAYKAGAAFDIS